MSNETARRDSEPLTDEERAYIRELNEATAPLTPAIIGQLRVILRGGR